jgi:hypothetical protein
MEMNDIIQRTATLQNNKNKSQQRHNTQQNRAENDKVSVENKGDNADTLNNDTVALSQPLKPLSAAKILPVQSTEKVNKPAEKKKINKLQKKKPQSANKKKTKSGNGTRRKPSAAAIVDKNKLHKDFVEPMLKAIKTNNWTIVDLLLTKIKTYYDPSTRLGDLIVDDDKTILELCGQYGSKELFTALMENNHGPTIADKKKHAHDKLFSNVKSEGTV